MPGYHAPTGRVRDAVRLRLLEVISGTSSTSLSSTISTFSTSTTTLPHPPPPPTPPPPAPLPPPPRGCVGPRLCRRLPCRAGRGAVPPGEQRASGDGRAGHRECAVAARQGGYEVRSLRLIRLCICVFVYLCICRKEPLGGQEPEDDDQL